MALRTTSRSHIARPDAITTTQVELPIPCDGWAGARVAGPSYAAEPHHAMGSDRRQVERARIIANLTYEQLASAAHVDRATLSDMLTGRRNPTLGSVHAVIRALGLDPAAVLVFK